MKGRCKLRILMKILFANIFVFLSIVCSKLSAQTLISLQVNGLTCSQCSYSVERSLLQLSFIKSVDMDLNTHVAKLVADVQVDQLAQIARKVEEAGFSVGLFQFAPTAADSLLRDKSNLIILNPENDTLAGNKVYQIIDRKYCSKKTYRKWESAINRINDVRGQKNLVFVIIVPKLE